MTYPVTKKIFGISGWGYGNAPFSGMTDTELALLYVGKIIDDGLKFAEKFAPSSQTTANAATKSCFLCGCAVEGVDYQLEEVDPFAARSAADDDAAVSVDDDVSDDDTSPIGNDDIGDDDSVEDDDSGDDDTLPDRPLEEGDAILGTVMGTNTAINTCLIEGSGVPDYILKNVSKLVWILPDTYEVDDRNWPVPLLSDFTGEGLRIFMQIDGNGTVLQEQLFGVDLAFTKTVEVGRITTWEGERADHLGGTVAMIIANGYDKVLDLQIDVNEGGEYVCTMAYRMPCGSLPELAEACSEE